jgi:hypothetical protein
MFYKAKRHWSPHRHKRQRPFSWLFGSASKQRRLVASTDGLHGALENETARFGELNRTFKNSKDILVNCFSEFGTACLAMML